MKKILLLTLVICTLGYGSAWAFDGHAVDLSNITPISIKSVSDSLSNHVHDDQSAEYQSTEQQSTVDLLCDHCGHISAHLQAIFTQSSYLRIVNQSSEISEYSENFISYIVSPDRRPPRV